MQISGQELESRTHVHFKMVTYSDHGIGEFLRIAQHFKDHHEASDLVWSGEIWLLVCVWLPFLVTAIHLVLAILNFMSNVVIF